MTASRSEIEKLQRQRRRWTVCAIIVLAVFSAVASVLAIVAWSQRQEAKRQGDEAKRQSAAARLQLDLSRIERGRQLLWDGYPFQAAPYLASAYSDGVDHRPLRIMLALASRSLPNMEVVAGEELTRLGFSPDGTRVIAHSSDGRDRAWDIQTGQAQPVPANPGPSIEILSIGDNRVLLHEPNTGRVRCVLSRRTTETPAGANASVALSGDLVAAELAVPDDDRSRLVTASRGVSDDTVFITPGRVAATAQVWDGATCRLLYSLFPEHDSDAVHSASFSGDGKRLVTTSEDSAQIWDLSDASSITVLRGHQGAVHAAVLSNDGGIALTAGEDRTARLWDATTGRQVAAFEGHKAAVFLVAISPDGTRAATATKEGTIRVWNADDGLLITDHHACAGGAADDGSCYLPEAQVLDPAIRGQIALFLGHKGMVSDLRWSPDRALAVTASEDRTAWLWEAQRHRPLASFSHPKQVLHGRFEDGGKTLVTSTRDHEWAWDIPFEVRSPATFAKLVACYVPFVLNDEQLDPAASSICAHTFDDLPPVRGESRRRADALVAAGDAALRRRAFANAALHYDQAQKLDPHDTTSRRLATAIALQAGAPSSPQELFDAAQTAFRDIHDVRSALDLLAREHVANDAAPLFRLELLLAMDRLDEVAAGAPRARLTERDEDRLIALDFTAWAALKLSGRPSRDERAAARQLLRSAQEHGVRMPPHPLDMDVDALADALRYGHHRHDEVRPVIDVLRHVYLIPGDENFMALAALLGLNAFDP